MSPSRPIRKQESGKEKDKKATKERKEDPAMNEIKTKRASNTRPPPWQESGRMPKRALRLIRRDHDEYLLQEEQGFNLKLENVYDLVWLLRIMTGVTEEAKRKGKSDLDDL
ncbi:hypothetical protein M378DRAFT_17583 [Amanita muscaria Koide BX008]|uniref:Uncharacterized protein n=1 Tax=Amanita muscaria (strain Koide BX008) TaxID=946122 RepID=A0A0C2WGS4_AMAMK|nr:hypothetical protein M378DRAFT_17583 [Amanita muscaria Koide BX008]